jgi:BirA family biotin operon repressor/biotin-[acetyl-CoA-carboxylase] ligase
MKIIQFDTIDSTNDYLKTHYLELPDFSVVMTHHQTQGKGRLGRVWMDDGTQALFSILLKNHLFIGEIEHYSLLTAMAVHQVLSKDGLNLKIKWPNDIVYKDLKLCGILCESVISHQQVEALVIGIGININTVVFPESLKKTATSLKLINNKDYQIEALIHEILMAFKILLSSVKQNKTNIIDYCNQHASLTHRKIQFTYQDQPFIGIVDNILPDGSLQVQTSKGPLILHSGEVTLH